MKIAPSVIAMTLTLATLTTASASPNHEPPPRQRLQATQMESGGNVGYDRTIQVGPSTRWVNVKRSETIRFVVDEGGTQHEFIRRIDVPSTRSLSLSALAPDGMMMSSVNNVKVFVAPDRFSRR